MIWTILANHPLITYPVKGLMVSLILAIILRAKKKRRSAQIISISSITFFYLFSLPCISKLLIHSLENKYMLLNSTSNTPAADAVVSLGGNSIAFDEIDLNRELQTPTHRLTTAIKIAKSGSARNLIISGGKESGSFDEISLSYALARRSGLENNKIIIGNSNSNTISEAQFIGKKAKDNNWDRIIIVTSAYHMNRAILAIKKQTNAILIPISVDFRTVEINQLTGNQFIDQFIPSFTALNESTRVMKEYAGIAYTSLSHLL